MAFSRIMKSFLLILMLAVSEVFFGRDLRAQDFDDDYERRAQEAVAGLVRLNGLRGWTPQAPATWPVSLAAPGDEHASIRTGRGGGVRWNHESPAGLIFLNLVNQNLQRVADLSGLSSLERLELAGNGLKALNLDGNTALVRLVVTKNQLASLKPGSCPRLTYLAVPNNQLRALDLSANIHLTDIHASANQLTEIDVSHQGGLVNLDVMNNRLTEISVWANPALERLLVSYNRLKTLDLSANRQLRVLGARDNELTELSLAANPQLTELTISRNGLKKLDLSANPLIARLSAEQNRFTVLDLSGLSRLEHLSLQRNPLTDIVLGGNTLEHLVSLNLDDCRLPLSRLAFWSGQAQNRARLGNQKDVLFVQTGLKAGEILDLSGEAEIEGEKTVFSVLTDKGRRVKPDDYREAGGKIVFHRPGLYRVMMTNEKVFSSEINRTTGQMRPIKVKIQTGVVEVTAATAEAAEGGE